MGASIAWLAVRTEDPSALFREARVEPTTDPDPHFEAAISGCALEGGWFLLVARRCDHRLVDPAVLGAISREYRCVACTVEEHVMYSSAANWKDGREVWRVSHDAQKGRLHLEARGEPPEGFDELRRRKLREQEEEDAGRAEVDVVFDVPLLMAQKMAGFKHDQDPPARLAGPPVAFVDLAPETPRPWWKVW